MTNRPSQEQAKYVTGARRNMFRSILRGGVVAIGLLALGGVVGWFAHDWPVESPELAAEKASPTPDLPRFGFGYLMDRWNESVQKLIPFDTAEDRALVRSALLPANDPAAALRRLDRIIQRVCGEDDVFEREVKKLASVRLRTPWPSFASVSRTCKQTVRQELLAKLHRQSIDRFDGEEIERWLMRLVGADYRYGMIQEVLERTHPCFFFYDNRSLLVRQGVSRNIRHCRDFATEADLRRIGWP